MPQAGALSESKISSARVCASLAAFSFEVRVSTPAITSSDQRKDAQRVAELARVAEGGESAVSIPFANWFRSFDGTAIDPRNLTEFCGSAW